MAPTSPDFDYDAALADIERQIAEAKAAQEAKNAAKKEELEHEKKAAELDQQGLLDAPVSSVGEEGKTVLAAALPALLAGLIGGKHGLGDAQESIVGFAKGQDKKRMDAKAEKVAAGKRKVESLDDMIKQFAKADYDDGSDVDALEKRKTAILTQQAKQDDDFHLMERMKLGGFMQGVMGDRQIDVNNAEADKKFALDQQAKTEAAKRAAAAKAAAGEGTVPSPAPSAPQAPSPDGNVSFDGPPTNRSDLVRLTGGDGEAAPSAPVVPNVPKAAMLAGKELVGDIAVARAEMDAGDPEAAKKILEAAGKAPELINATMSAWQKMATAPSDVEKIKATNEYESVWSRLKTENAPVAAQAELEQNLNVIQDAQNKRAPIPTAVITTIAEGFGGKIPVEQVATLAARPDGPEWIRILYPMVSGINPMRAKNAATMLKVRSANLASDAAVQALIPEEMIAAAQQQLKLSGIDTVREDWTDPARLAKVIERGKKISEDPRLAVRVGNTLGGLKSDIVAGTTNSIAGNVIGNLWPGTKPTQKFAGAANVLSLKMADMLVPGVPSNYDQKKIESMIPTAGMAPDMAAEMWGRLASGLRASSAVKVEIANGRVPSPQIVQNYINEMQNLLGESYYIKDEKTGLSTADSVATFVSQMPALAKDSADAASKVRQNRINQLLAKGKGVAVP